MSDCQTVFPHPKTGDKLPAVWRDKNDVLHRAVGDQMIPTDRGTFIMWTACGWHDVPANGAWLQTSEDIVSCDGCKHAETVWEEDAREEELASGQFGVGA